MKVYIRSTCILLCLLLSESAEIGRSHDRMKRQTQTIGNTMQGNINFSGTQSGIQIGPKNNIDTTSGTMKNEEPEILGCRLPSVPNGGSYKLDDCGEDCSKMTGDEVPIGSILNYACNNGYTSKGNTISVCRNKKWTDPPICQKMCSPLKSNTLDITCTYQGSTVPCDSVVPGTRATLGCKQHHKTSSTNEPAYRELTCLEEGVWDQSLFRCFPECGTSVSSGDPLIVGGFKAEVGVFPWHVGIYSKNRRNEHEQICAGTLISSNLVVSAAHCFYDHGTNKALDASGYAVAAGKNLRSWNADEKFVQKSDVSSIDLGRRYRGAEGNFAEDIAILFLKTPFRLSTLVKPVCVDWENVFEREQLNSRQSGKAVGWGKTSEGVMSEELQELNLPFIPYEKCLPDVPEDFRGYVTTDKFCAGYLNGSSLCEGDSGGGLCFQQNGLWYLRGVVSVSPVKEGSCDNNYYTAFTNVGIFRDWIRNAYIQS